MWLLGQKWQCLDSDDFICSPKMSYVAVRVLATEGENVTLSCRVESEAAVSISWLVGNKRIYNTNESLRFYISELTIANNTIYTSTLTVTGVQPQDQDSYRCLAENRAGYSEVHVSLRVPHALAEVHAADTEPTSYMNIGLILGVLAVILFLLLLLSFVYWRFHIGRTAQQGKEKCDVPQAARTSEEEMQIFDGYHMIPSNELEDISQRLHSFQHSWLSSRAERWDNTNQSLSEHNAGYSQEHPVINVSNVDIPISLEGTANALEDQPNYRDVIIHTTDSRIPSSHICPSTLGLYKDDMNFPQFDGQENSSALHTLNSSYCAIPRGSSSGLNLFLSEASSNAYGNSQIAAHPVLHVGSTGQSQNYSSMQDLMIYKEYQSIQQHLQIMKQSYQDHQRTESVPM
ncbi:hypothetical protein SK128_025047 [Halocaridina rubra]|uniref:Ig-like domain-containing protein n=1 Tax=Halocaridina rubra TaxID=373956 RepID=A0AAN8X6I4_HALRR